MDSFIKAAELAGIDQTDKVSLNNHINEEKHKGVLKLEYSLLGDRLVIKDSSTECIGLLISPEQSLELISKLRSIVREGDSISDIDISDYSIFVACNGHKRPAEDIHISVMQISGEMSKPILSKEFSGYYGKSSLLEGLSFASKKIGELCD